MSKNTTDPTQEGEGRKKKTIGDSLKKDYLLPLMYFDKVATLISRIENAKYTPQDIDVCRQMIKQSLLTLISLFFHRIGPWKVSTENIQFTVPRDFCESYEFLSVRRDETFIPINFNSPEHDVNHEDLKNILLELPVLAIKVFCLAIDALYKSGGPFMDSACAYSHLED
jgi:hypothetical protein